MTNVSPHLLGKYNVRLQGRQEAVQAPKRWMGQAPRPGAEGAAPAPPISGPFHNSSPLPVPSEVNGSQGPRPPGPTATTPSTDPTDLQVRHF